MNVRWTENELPRNYPRFICFNALPGETRFLDGMGNLEQVKHQLPETWIIQVSEDLNYSEVLKLIQDTPSEILLPPKISRPETPDEDTTAPDGYIWVLLVCDNLSYEYSESFCAVGTSILSFQVYIDSDWTGSELTPVKLADGNYYWYPEGRLNSEEYRAELHKVL